ncbi:MAG: hypothetical protein U0Q04_06300 [Microbacterium sp.]
MSWRRAETVAAPATAFGAGNGNAAPAVPAMAPTTSAQIRSWVLQNCAAVPDAPVSDLYDCAG